MDYNVTVANRLFRDVTRMELKLLHARLRDNMRKVEEDQAKIAELEDQLSAISFTDG